MSSGSDRGMRFQVVTAWDATPQAQAWTCDEAQRLLDQVRKRFPDDHARWIWVVDTEEPVRQVEL